MASKKIAVAPRVKPFTPDPYERVLACGAIVLLGFVFAALLRGRPDWPIIAPVIWFHLATIVIALGLTPVMLLRERGDTLHRRIGWLWAVALMLTAIDSFMLRGSNHGRLSIIHILSVYTIIQVPLIIWTARHHKVVRHRRAVRGMVTGALLIAGFFTFPFDRLLGHWLFG